MYTSQNTIFPSTFVFVADIRYSAAKMTSLTVFFLQLISYLSGIGISTIPDHQGAPSEPQNCHMYTPQNTIYPSTFVFVTHIRYSTTKMTPLTISLLQPISNLSGIGISTIPNHRGPHQSPKTATHTPKKQLFS